MDPLVSNYRPELIDSDGDTILALRFSQKQINLSRKHHTFTYNNILIYYKFVSLLRDRHGPTLGHSGAVNIFILINIYNIFQLKFHTGTINAFKELTDFGLLII